MNSFRRAAGANEPIRVISAAAVILVLLHYAAVWAAAKYLGRPGCELAAASVAVAILALSCTVPTRTFLAIWALYIVTFRFVGELTPTPELFDVAIVLSAYGVVIRTLSKRGDLRLGPNAFVVLLMNIAFYAIWVASAIVNGSGVRAILLSGVWHFYPIVVFLTLYCSSARLAAEDLIRTAKFFGALLLLQLPVQLLQVRMHAADVHKVFGHMVYGVYQDDVVGTFGQWGTRVQAVLGLAGCYSAALFAVVRGLSWRILLFISACFVISLIGDTTYFRAGLYVAPLLIPMILYFSGAISRRVGRLLAIAFVVLPVFVIGLQIVGDKYVQVGLERPFAGGRILDLAFWKRSLGSQYMVDDTGYFEVGRIRGLEIAIDRMTESVRTFVIGGGPDSARVVDSAVLGSRGGAQRAWYQNYFGLDRMLIEFGLAGAAAYIFLLAYLVFAGRELVRRARTNAESVVGLAYVACVLVFISTGLYDGGWFEPFQKGILFWALTGCVLRLSDRNLGPSRLPVVPQRVQTAQA